MRALEKTNKQPKKLFYQWRLSLRESLVLALCLRPLSFEELTHQTLSSRKDVGSTRKQKQQQKTKQKQIKESSVLDLDLVRHRT